MKKCMIAAWIPAVVILSGAVLSPRVSSTQTDSPQHPNIVIIVAGDYGWNDAGYHGSDLKTPNRLRRKNGTATDFRRSLC